MKIRYLVLLALVCLCAHLAAASDAKKEKSPKAEKAEKAERPEREKFETEDEEIEVIHHSKKKEKEKKAEKKVITEVIHKKKEKAKKEVVPCSVLTAPNKVDCEAGAPAGYKAIFDVKEDAACDWTCNYEALPTPAPPVVTKPPKKLKKEKKEKQEKNLKECSGEQKIHASNCLFKLNGLIAWGGKTKNFEKKWEKFLAKAKAPKGGSKKAPAKKGKKAKKAPVEGGPPAQP